MNYLAHVFLAGEAEGLIIGNFIADAIKGRQYELYNNEVSKGILMHRHIDTFTDSHEITARSKARLRPEYGKYSGIIMDVFYDHFLAENWHNYTSSKLESFTNNVYKLLFRNYGILPSRMQRMLPFMTFGNWLYHYKYINGVEKSLSGISRRLNHGVDLSKSVEMLVIHYTDFEKDFRAFMDEAILFANDFRNNQLE